MGSAERVKFGFGRSLEGSFDDALVRVKAAFKAEGFGLITEVDFQKTLREKIGEEIEPYRILGMCNPDLASQALKAEHQVGLLLPCNVIVHECGGRVHVAAQDPEALMAIADSPALEPIADEAKRRIEKAMMLL